jgi:uncharacterized membrane protein
MRNSLARRLGAAVITVGGAVAVTITPTATAAAATWTTTALQTPAGVFSVRVNGTDGVNQTVGSYDTIEGGQHRPGVIWRGTTPTVLGEAFGELTDLTAINTSGVAVGSHATPTPEPAQAVRWTGDHYEDLPAPAGSSSMAMSINERGDIVGTADGQVIFWPAAAPGTYRLLRMPYSNSSAGPVAIDDAGTIVAALLEPVSGGVRAFRWDHQISPRELDHAQQNSGHNVVTVENGRIAGGASVFGAVIWDALGHVRRFMPDVAIYGMNTNGDLLARVNGPWFVERNGVRTSLPDNFLPSFWPTSLFNDGSVVGYTTDSSTGRQTAVLFRRG